MHNDNFVTKAKKSRWEECDSGDNHLRAIITKTPAATVFLC